MANASKSAGNFSLFPAAEIVKTVKVTQPPDRPQLFKAKTVNRWREKATPGDLSARHAVILKWLKADADGKLDVPESMLDGTFLEDVFGKVLGYRNRIEGGDTWDREFEDNVKDKGRRSVDGSVGFYSLASDAVRRIAVIELKGANVDLAIGVSGKKSPVEQAWDYANASPGCRWVIVSNFRETRLYHYARGNQVWHTFWLKDLSDAEAFARFYLILDRRFLLPAQPDGKSDTERMLDDSDQQQRDVTRQLYQDYRAIRATLFEHLCKRHPNLPADAILRCTQTLIDRFLFAAFASQRDLLRPDLLKRAMEAQNLFEPKPLWHNLRALFRWIDVGKSDQGVPAYNGGLFREDEAVDDLDVADEDLGLLMKLYQYDFRDDVSVEVLGHIFEQSISDLEKMRAQARGEAQTDAVGKRDLEGVFYTPSYVTRFMVDVTLRKYLRESREELKRKLGMPTPDEPAEAHSDERWLPFNLAWKDVLLGVRVLDPACGSGAFLCAAYDCLAAEYDKLNRLLARTGQEQVDLTDAILQHNLFGVDLNAESVEITKLSLWLKTAVRGRKLTDLDWTIRRGNSVVSDPEVHELAFDWDAGRVADLQDRALESQPTPDQAAILAQWQEKFDVVLGNPPYVRHEWLDKASKAHWKARFGSYDGAADLYVYFFEQALQVCKVGGLVGFVTNNKWLRAEYGKALRVWLDKNVHVEQLVDFGHARIFEGTDTFPCVTVIRHEPPDVDDPVQVCVLPREVMAPDKLAELVHARQFPVLRTRFRPEGWTLERAEVDGLMEQVRAAGSALKDVVGAAPNYGIKTGANEAFLVNAATRDTLVAAEPGLDAVIRPYLRGQDVGRWVPEASDLHMIVLRSSENHPWPWSDSAEPEATFAATFPALYQHMLPSKQKLVDRQDQGRYWWELRSCTYYDAFEQPKIVYQEIQYHPHYAFDDRGLYGNNKVFLLPSADLYLLGVLNSPLVWWFNWRYLPHMKDEALSPAGFLMENVPIADPTPAVRAAVESRVAQLIAAKRQDHTASRLLLDWLRAEHGVTSPGRTLEDFGALDHAQFEAEVKKRRPKDLGAWKPTHVANLREAWETYGKPTAARRIQAGKLEDDVARLVEQAYGLSDDDVKLLWETAPPRMPGKGPQA